MEENVKVKSSVFIVSWILLMMLTGGLLLVGTSSLPTFPRHFLIYGMMAVQAYLVSFYFMHLRYERLPLILSVVLGVVVTATFFYVLLAWEGSHVIKVTGS